jgi:hypothetical protein
MHDHEPTASPAAAHRHGHIDTRAALAKQAPENRGAHVTEDGALPNSKNSSEETALGAQPREPYRVHTTVYTVQPSGPHTPPDRVVAQAEGEQLRPGDHPVLPETQLGKPPIERGCRDFLAHTERKWLQPPSRPPYLPVVRLRHQGAE